MCCCSDNFPQLGVFIGTMGLMEGRGPDQIREKFRDLFKPALLTNWKVWPLAQVSRWRCRVPMGFDALIS